jgi:CRP-like cAMP-binding protein
LATLLTPGALAVNARRLVDLANERGGKDNITTLLIRALPDERPERTAVVRGIGLKLEILKRVRLFKHVTYKELVMLLNLTQFEVREPGVEVTTEGDADTDFYIVLDGRVAVTQDGHLLAELSPGDHFGEMELIMARSRSATVTTIARVELLTIHRDDVVALLKADEHLGVKLLWSFLQTLSVRLHQTSRKLTAAMDDEEPSSPF